MPTQNLSLETAVNILRDKAASSPMLEYLSKGPEEKNPFNTNRMFFNQHPHNKVHMLIPLCGRGHLEGVAYLAPVCQNVNVAEPVDSQNHLQMGMKKPYSFDLSYK